MKYIRSFTLLAVVFLTISANAQYNIVYYPNLRSEESNLDKLKLEALQLLEKGDFIGDLKIQEGYSGVKYSFENNFIIAKTKDIKFTISLNSSFFVFKSKNKKYLVQLKDKFNIGLFDNIEDSKKLADVLYTMQFILYDEINGIFKKELEEQNALFDSLAQKYRLLAVKPSISEEQRKYIVQANGFNDEKQYAKAIELYKKAIDVDQTAYPAAYYNLALLSANLKQFQDAIYYMKKYLMLVPDAEDARNAQDKIYLWEAQIGN